MLPDPSAADHLFPSRAASRRESDDADVRARRNVARTKRDVFTRETSGEENESGGRETETSDSDASGDDAARRRDGSVAHDPTSDPPDGSALKPPPAASDDADPKPDAASASDRFPALRDAAGAFWAADAGRVRDWSTCDRMCSKVLGPYARAHPEAGDAARALLRWAREPDAPPFARRAALVTFVNDVDDDDDAHSAEARFGDGFVSLLAGTCAAALGIRARVLTRGGENACANACVFAEALGERDEGETSDLTTDPEAWVRVGARWMLSLCARAAERRTAAVGAAVVSSPSAAKETARLKPTKRPRSRREGKRAAPA